MPHLAQHRNQQVLAYLDLVLPIANHYARVSGQEPDDLIQVGRLGLLKAAQHHNPKVGRHFQGFAKAHIRGSILHYLRDSSGVVRLPRRLQEQAQRMLRQERGQEASWRPPLTAEESLAINAYRQQMQWIEFDDQYQPARKAQPGGWSQLVQTEQTRTLTDCWTLLPEQEQECIHAVVIEGSSLRETAKRLGTSAMTVQRRVKHGLQTLLRSCLQRGLKG